MFVWLDLVLLDSSRSPMFGRARVRGNRMMYFVLSCRGRLVVSLSNLPSIPSEAVLFVDRAG